MKKNISIYQSAQELAEANAEKFAEFAHKFNVKDRSAFAAVSGGTTPKQFFTVLAEKYGDKINWSYVHFFWVDERCVPPEHPESNFGMTKKHLLDHITIPKENIHRIYGESDPKSEVKRYSDEIKNTVLIENGLPKFDLILLGMGADGHTASIFPGQLKLLKSDYICEVAEHPLTHQKRVTLTGKIICNAADIKFIIAGENKAKVVADIINKSEESKNYPAAHISAESGKLEWLFDESAAKLLVHK